ncbi:centrosomal protein of 97 kDa [Coccinella septempunctata]|uniref:centrosomal protein of 97 kDa n=1 Tax=Coccinella septempunctata TaxID=41139 RepID=UPI001D063E0F|nr:centrosomal protein of 97 kDa [Coccinella septempunctata]
MEDVSQVLNLSNKKLKKINKLPLEESQNVTSLILDDNELQRLDNIDSFLKVQKLSIVRNQLLRMYGVCRLHSLHTLNLAHNGILTIEGLKELVNLKWLCLAGNNIKTIEHLNTNTQLEYLDLSENSIIHVNDISFLKCLKELYLHNNKINHLVQCDRFLPVSLTNLTLANNNISDLNEISQLVHLTNLTSISIANNPCVNMSGKNIGFDYRPFVINWLMNVTVIDGYVVDAIESLRAEWLYSQGRGRHFRIGDHSELVQYLASVCPLSGEALETEEDRKLRLILSKAQQHQRQLRDQESNGESPNPSPMTRKKLNSSKNHIKPPSSRYSKSPDRMSSSYYNSNSVSESSFSVMSHSMDPSLFSQSFNSDKNTTTNDMSQSMVLEKCLDSEPVNSPLQALSKMVPVPESLMSPDYRPPSLNKINSPASTSSVKNTRSPVVSVKAKNVTGSPKNIRTPVSSRLNSVNSNLKKCASPVPARHKNATTNGSNKLESTPKKQPTSILRKSISSDDDSVCDSKLQTIQLKAEERRQLKDADVGSNSSTEDKVEQAAVCIQKIWRGYYTRNKNKEVQQLFRDLQNQRANQYIQKLASDMENTKAALESERKIQMLQTEAISALWKKVSAIQPDNVPKNYSLNDLRNEENGEIIKHLAQTCTVLQNQIHQLQASMEEIVKVMTLFSQAAGLSRPLSDKENGIATQTEIIAVHTPQGEAAKNFPFQKQTRPSSLPLPVSAKKKDSSQQSGNHLVSDLRQFAGSLVDGVLKTVSETKADNLGQNTMEITITDTDQKNEEKRADEK